jgi:nucleoside 2-deoxyribosyltransferase
MNCLKGVRIYLAGPVESERIPEAWREKIQIPLQKLGMTVLNPLVKPVWVPNVTGERQLELRMALQNDPSSPETNEKIIGNDQTRAHCLSLVRMADIIVVNFGRKQFTVGTFEEMISAKGKPIFIICDDVIPSMWLCSFLNTYTKSERNLYLHKDIDSCVKMITYISKFGQYASGRRFDDLCKWIFITHNLSKYSQRRKKCINR